MCTQVFESDAVRTWRENRAGWIELARPERGNAYTQPMLRRFQQAIHEFSLFPDIAVIVVTASGPSFSGGADKHELAGRGWNDALRLLSAEVFQQLANCPRVTIAAINGPAVGGGFELALACDLRLAASTARFWLPEPDLGLIPAAGGTFRLTQIVGPARAKELILAGREWDADEAYRAGLVSSVVPPGELRIVTQRWVERIVLRSLAALELAKQGINLAAGGQFGPTYERTAQALLYELRRQSANAAAPVSAADSPATSV